MHLRFELLTAEQARAIADWRYPPPYDFYDATGDEDDLRELLDRAGPYYAALDEHGALVGFFCFKQTAQVPAGIPAGVYADPHALDVGLGMHPYLTGRGLGLAFVEAGLAFARDTFAPRSFRLSVATFNRRAIAVYARVGFRPLGTFVSHTNGGEHEFLVMTRPASAVTHAFSRHAGALRQGEGQTIEQTVDEVRALRQEPTA
jgi:RimJ/RimL family protein N-acetyltransferase